MDTTPRLVNAYLVRVRPVGADLVPTLDVVTEGCSGDPLALLADAAASPFAVGVLAVDVHTGERWFAAA